MIRCARCGKIIPEYYSDRRCHYVDGHAVCADDRLCYAPVKTRRQKKLEELKVRYYAFK